MAGHEDEKGVRAFIRGRVEAMRTLAWEELARYGSRTEQFRTRVGSPYRVISKAYWDVGERSSPIEIEVRVAGRP